MNGSLFSQVADTPPYYPNAKRGVEGNSTPRLFVIGSLGRYRGSHLTASKAIRRETYGS